MSVPRRVLFRCRIAVLALALLVGLGLQSSEAQIDWLEMGIDAAQDGSSGGGISVPLGSSHQVDVRVDDLFPPFPEGGYIGYQVTVRYDDSKLDLSLPHDENANNSWPGAGGVFCFDVEPVENDTGTKDWLGNCLDMTLIPSDYIGVIHTLEFTCEAAGDASIQLLPGVAYTFLAEDEMGSQHAPDILVNDTITCYPPCLDRLGDTQCDDPVNDNDDDGCTDTEEQAGASPPKPGATGAYDPTAWYDFYDVPVPARADRRGTGTLACWGSNSQGQSTPPAGAFSQVGAGLYHTCGVKTDGTLACWGDDTYGQATPPAGTFSQVSAGREHTCGVRTDGTLACWGKDNYGQATPPAGSFSQVSAGDAHTCGVRTDGTLACWGDDTRGQATPPAGTFTQVSAGGEHNCGVRTDGTLDCWGWNADGQATPPSGTFSQVSAGVWHTCGVKTDGTLACWGDNLYGQATPPAGTFSQVSAGWRHNCGVRTDGTLACWGWNYYGQATPPAGTFTQVSAGWYHTCGVMGYAANGKRDRAVAMDDVLAVLFYVGTYDGDAGVPNANGVAYDTIKGVDLDGDTTNDIPPPFHDIKEGVKYDRSPGGEPNPPWDAGPPDGAVAMDDVLAVLAQSGLSCIDPP